MIGPVLFSAMKNEAPFILEWVAYHKAIGFKKIVVYSNASDDGTTELLDALAAAGEIEHNLQEVPEGVSAQGNAARLANEAGIVVPGEWVMWLDADEFLNIKTADGRVEDLVEVIGEKHGMLIPWRTFGDGGNTTFTGRFVSAAFCGASRPDFLPNREIKTFFRASKAISGFASCGINRPALSPSPRLTCDDFLTARGTPLAKGHGPHCAWLAGKDVAKTSKISDDEAGWELAQINHYCVRTPEYFALKRARGRGWTAGQAGTSNKRHTADFYKAMNRNEDHDDSILRFEDAVTEGIGRLRQYPAVAQAEVEAKRRTAALLARAQEAAPIVVDVKPQRRQLESSVGTEERRLLQAACRGAGTVLEYGCGGSTLLALDAGAGYVMSVDNEVRRFRKVARKAAADYPANRLFMHYVDIGPTEEGGRPKKWDRHQDFHRYATEIWDLPEFREPDVVLIDGQFRVACFLTTLLRATKEVSILFDDYAERPEYHWIEELLQPGEMRGSMAVFTMTAPVDLPRASMTRIVGSFADYR